MQVDPQGRLRSANKPARALLGLPAEAALPAEDLAEFLVGEGARELGAQFARAMAGERVTVEWTMRARDGVLIRGNFVLARTGADGLLVVARGDGRAAAAEAHLRQSERRLRLAQQVGRVGVFEWLIPEDRLDWSPELEALYGLPPGAAPSRLDGWLRLLVPADATRIREELTAGFRRRQREQAFEFRLVLPDGTHRWLAAQARFTYDELGRPTRAIGVNVDIHERKRNELRSEFIAQLVLTVRPLAEPADIVAGTLRLLGEYLRVDRCAYATFAPDEDTFTVLGNHARGLPAMTGSHRLSAFGEELARSQREGTPFILTDTEAPEVPSEARTRFRQMGARALIALPLKKEGRLVAGVALHERQPRRWTAEELELAELAANSCWESIERSRVAAELHASERRLRMALAAARMVAWEVDPATGKAVVLDNAAEVFGLPANSSLRDTEAGFALMHPDDVERHRETFARAIRECGGYQTQFRMVRPDGQGILWIEERAYAIRDEHGRAKRFVGLMIDITERRRAEEQLREAHALLADKAAHLETLVQQRTARLQETIGELEAFSYSIAHDLRGPLRSMRGFAQVLLEDHAADLRPEARGFLRRIANAADRMDRLTRDVLSYSRVVQAAAARERVDVEALVRDLVETYPQLGSEHADIVLESPLPPVLGNLALLTQVFSNLLGNAIKFVPAGVRPRVVVRAERREERVRFFLTDNGIGIAPEQRERIFSLFEKLRPEYEGTGVGLPIVKKALERMGGAVGVDSQVGQGSTFWVDLPAA